MLAILDTAIGLSFVFLLFSLLAAAFNEIVLSFFDQRARFLREGLQQMLGNDQPTLDAFISHGLIDSFSRNVNGKPAYIPPDAFVAALLDLINPVIVNSAQPTLVRTAGNVAAALNPPGESLLKSNQKLAATLRVLFDEAKGDLDAFKKGLENWFNQSMDRVSGWYKRRSQKMLLFLSVFGAVACNVDAIRISQALSSDPKLRAGVVEAATEKVNAGLGKVNQNPPAPASPDDTAKVVSADVNALTKQFRDTLTQLNSFSLPIGWGDNEWNYLFSDPGQPRTDGCNLNHIISAVAGWFLTALAASLGAPFWFDILTRFINIRGNGPKPEDAAKARAENAAKVATKTVKQSAGAAHEGASP